VESKKYFPEDFFSILSISGEKNQSERHLEGHFSQINERKNQFTKTTMSKKHLGLRFLSDSRWRLWSKMATENQSSKIFRFCNIFDYLLSFAICFYFDQQHDPKSYLAKFTKNGGPIQDGGSKSDFWG
jgi:hypothetical protein